MHLGVDVGGTFTDAVLFDGQAVHTAKAPTTPDEESSGVEAAIRAVLKRAGASPEAVSTFAHGMTVATNALLTESGARTALVATEGFTDLLDIARQDRPSLYRPCDARPRPLVEDGLRFGARERVSDGGVATPLEGEEVDRIVREVEASGASSVAVCLLFSHVDPGHEAAIAAALRNRLDGVHVSVSSEVLAQFREYERCSTTVIDAYLSPLLGHYLGRLERVCEANGLPAPAVMKSSGGVGSAEELARSGAQAVLSGPAGGAVGAALLARLSGERDVVGLDMGGTSCDVCVVSDGAVRRTDSREIGGRVIQLPMVDVHTVGAGGGSVAWRDEGGALRVGPRSAGARPGPACYGRGGAEPTVTDANLLLGYLPEESGLAGGVQLDPSAASGAVAGLAQALGLSELEAAEGIVRVANVEMIRALRVSTVERGVDPRRFALMPFGGAGPLHAAAIAEELGMRTILCPRAGGVLSALGLACSERRRDTARTVLLSGTELTAEHVAREVEGLRRSLGDGSGAARLEAVYELRYRGQAFELPIAGSPSPDPAELAEAFAAEHEARYGYRDPDAEVELVTVRLAVVEEGPEVVPRASEAEVSEGRRRARFGGEWVDARILRGEPPAGTRAEGPCVFELPESTLVLPPGWTAQVDERGTVVARAAA
jgi:N-methylhydantoinase A